MKRINDILTEEEIKNIFHRILSNDIKKLQFQIRSNLEIIFYNNGRIEIKENDKITEINMPWYVEENIKELEDNNYDDLIKMINNKFKILKDEKDRDEIKFSIEMTEDKYKYIKK
ncbi:MAG: hypothetical protein EU547_03010 [Promethearchaeota archaeon]|nr:MAG: hypothetical protein EU547_03010 [Candidatus Lokiarchaeota archaeon]